MSSKITPLEEAREPNGYKPAIRVSNLSKVYQIYERPEDRLKQSILPRIQRLIGLKSRSYCSEFWALKDITLELQKGETVGIIGRNGAGKSTLLQIVCGTLSPSSGDVEINGRVAALLELGSGFNPEFTGRENIYMNASILGLARDEIDAKLQQIIDFSDIGAFIEQPVKNYSSGMLVRLAFSVIAHVDAEILIIDEALSVGDVFFTQKCMRFLRTFMKHGSVIFVSHDSTAVLNLCDTAILLEHGKVLMHGAAKEVVESYLENSPNQIDSAFHEHGETTPKKAVQRKRDMRLDFLNKTNLRNDIELFSFDPLVKQYGVGGAKVINAFFLDANNDELSWLVGGEFVGLKIVCCALEDLHNPIVGFTIKDRLGQAVFSENTFLFTLNSSKQYPANSHFSATFSFYMPRIPNGDYTISLAVASGTQEAHIQHHWLHDAMKFKVQSSSALIGLIGLDIADVELSCIKS